MIRADHAGAVLDGRYRLIQKIGEGGMGSVYLGQHALIGRKVAVKLLRVELASNKPIVERFYREAQAAAAIKHQNIIDIFDLGLAPWGEPYLAMEYLKGESLGTLMARNNGPLDLATISGIMEPTLKALAAAHEHGVIHRDLKPENIFLVHNKNEEPTIKLIDFGISKFMNEQGRMKLTQTGSLLGTPDFLSPEQARGEKEVDHHSDIWAIGIILYECLTMVRPFLGDNYNELIHNIKTVTPKPPSQVLPGCPAEADPIVLRALQKEPDDRYASALQMLEDFEKLPGFQERKERLKQCVEKVSNNCFTSDNLEDDTGTIPINVAAKVMDELNREKTPEDWSVVRAKSASRFKNAFFVVFGLIALAAVVIAGVSIYLSSARTAVIKGAKNIEVVAPLAALEKSQASDGVEILLKGLPPNAKIYYQDALVETNPFRVEKKATVMPLRIEAEGFETYSVMIAPEEDRTVEVSLLKKQADSKKDNSRPVRPAQDKISDSEKALESAARQGSLAGGNEAVAQAQQQLVYTKNKRFLKRCYDQALERGDAPRDEVLSINMRLSLQDDGRVSDVVLSGSGAKIPSLDECLKQEAGSWSFPQTAIQNPVEFTFAFTTKE